MKLIIKYLKRYKLLFILNAVSALGFALVELGIPTIVADIIDYGISENNRTYIINGGLKILFVSVVGVIGTIIMGYCCAKISTGITHDIRLDLYKKIQKFSHNEFSEFKIAGLITRTNNDAFQIQLFVNTILRMAVLTPVMLIGSLILTYRSSSDLFWVIFATIPFIILGVIIVAKVTGPISEKQQRGLDDINRISRENLTGLRVIRSFNRQKSEEIRFSKTNEEFAHNSKLMFKIMQSTQPIFFLLMNIAVCRIYYVGAILISDGSLEIGKLVAFLDYLFHAMISMMLFCMIFMMYPRANVSAKRIQEVFDSDISIKNLSTEKLEDEENSFIEFRNVKYIKDGKTILNNINFTAKKGETIAIVGATGSGKSSLVRLIPRLSDPSEGEIRFNDKNIKYIDINNWRNKIGFVAQKAFLFKGSIRDNICFGNANAAEKDIIEAAEIAQAMDFISTRKSGFNDEIEENAANLSGGQKQRLSIARAIVRKPDIYIFDDAFSALDFKTDAKVRAALKSITGNAITFIVAQRISTIKDADKILVMNHGEIISSGKHNELLDSCKIYKDIVDSQIGLEEMLYEE